ncbi:MAG: glycosyltransferase family 4 protein [Ruminococcus sp.]
MEMKIMLITQLPPPSGGIATWSEKYIKYCEDNDVSLVVINNAMIGKRRDDFHAKKNLATELIRTLKIIASISKAQKEFMPSVVHFNTACSPLGIIRDYLCSLFIHKIPIVLHCRCTVQDQLKGNEIGIYFFKRLVKRVNTILVLNDNSMSYVENLCGRKSVKVPNYIDDAYIRRDKKVISDRVKNVLYTGHVQKQKGIDEILDAAKETPEIQYTLVGQIDEQYVQRTVTSNVIMTGNQPHEKVKELLDNSDVFLFPSYTEGFANSLAEAMARGLPCIASCAGANSDMIENHGGVIVPIADSGAIVCALEKIGSRDIRQQMSEWNVGKIENAYIIGRVMNRLFEIYREAQDGLSAKTK